MRPALLLAALLVAAPAWAQPSISGTSGTLSHGSTLTIDGSGFGTKATAAPYLWDTMDDGTYVASVWDSHQTIEAIVTTGGLRHARVTHHNRYNFNPDNYGGATGHSTVGTGEESDTWFLSKWVKFDSAFSWSGCSTPGTGARANMKWLRLADPDENGNNDPIVGIHEGNCIGTQTFLTNAAQDRTGFTNTHVPLDLTLGQWYHLEWEYANSSVGGSNGVGKVWLNGAAEVSLTTMALNPIGELRRPLDLGLWDSWGGGTAGNNYVYESEYYVDTSRARVYLCGAGSTFATRSACEMQIPVTWSATQITATINQGGLSVLNDSVDVYVCDSAGACNSSGVALASGGGGGDTPRGTSRMRFRSAWLDLLGGAAALGALWQQMRRAA